MKEAKYVESDHTTKSFGRKTIPVSRNISDSERSEFGLRMANKAVDISALEDEKKATVAHYNGKIKDAQNEMARFGNCIRTGMMAEEKLCEEIHDYTDGRVYHIEIESREIVQSRMMSQSETQIPLPMEDVEVIAVIPPGGTVEDAQPITKGEDDVEVEALPTEEGPKAKKSKAKKG